ncbi:hypothetical protein [Pseudoduganella sp. OTU4001]|uniref:hypothetical protein n=1 Tax=Pseudoduganella sp. OTU4001 TaxID=3043854 RepID=UPI00313C59C5
MSKTQDRIILQRTGALVFALGIVEFYLGWTSAPPGTFRFQIFGMLIGLLVVFGNSRAISGVRWLAWLALLPAAVFLVSTYALLPASLLLAQMRFVPGQFTIEVGKQLLVVAVVILLIRQLGSAPVLAARAAEGRKVRNMRIPLAIGGVLALSVTIMEARVLNNADAAKAVQLAAAHVGPGYEYFTNRLFYQYGKQNIVNARVQAWNERELIEIPVRWEMP